MCSRSFANRPFFDDFAASVLLQPKELSGRIGEVVQEGDGYLVEEVWRINSFGGHNHYHRSLSSYINALSEAGLIVSWLHEPPHQSESERIDREFLKTLPVFILIEAVRSDLAGA